MRHIAELYIYAPMRRRYKYQIYLYKIYSLPLTASGALETEGTRVQKNKKRSLLLVPDDDTHDDGVSYAKNTLTMVGFVQSPFDSGYALEHT